MPCDYRSISSQIQAQARRYLSTMNRFHKRMLISRNRKSVHTPEQAIIFPISWLVSCPSKSSDHSKMRQSLIFLSAFVALAASAAIPSSRRAFEIVLHLSSKLIHTILTKSQPTMWKVFWSEARQMPMPLHLMPQKQTSLASLSLISRARQRLEMEAGKAMMGLYHGRWSWMDGWIRSAWCFWLDGAFDSGWWWF